MSGFDAGFDKQDYVLRFANASSDALSTAAFLELKDMATGQVLSNLLGTSYNSVVTELYRATDTLQSHTCTIVAFLDDVIAGHISFMPANEFAARARASMLILGRDCRRVRWRLAVDNMRRRLRGNVLGPWAPNQVYFESLAVYPRHRRFGIATRLMEEAISRYPATQTFSLNARADNASAVALHEKIGFVVVQRRGMFQRMVRVPETHA